MSDLDNPVQPGEPFFTRGDASAVTKQSNPKDAVGVRKVPYSTVPSVVIAEVALAMLEGARKYRRHNYRIAGVRASVYYDACKRHLESWWEGQNMDPGTGNLLHHITKLISSAVVLRDAMLNDKWEDDRPPPMKNQNWVDDLNEIAGKIIDRFPDGLPPYTNAGLVNSLAKPKAPRIKGDHPAAKPGSRSARVGGVKGRRRNRA